MAILRRQSYWCNIASGEELFPEELIHNILQQEHGTVVLDGYSGCGKTSILKKIKEIADKFDIKSLIITNGADGAVYYDKTAGDCGHQPAIKTTVVDSTGAGDAFFSGAVGALSKGFAIF